MCKLPCKLLWTFPIKTDLPPYIITYRIVNDRIMKLFYCDFSLILCQIDRGGQRGGAFICKVFIFFDTTLHNKSTMRYAIWCTFLFPLLLWGVWGAKKISVHSLSPLLIQTWMQLQTATLCMKHLTGPSRIYHQHRRQLSLEDYQSHCKLDHIKNNGARLGKILCPTEFMDYVSYSFELFQRKS